MSGFAFDPVNPLTVGNLTQKDAGQDAILKIDGITIANTSSNTVTDAITGVTLSLTKTNVGTPTLLTISSDTSALKTKTKPLSRRITKHTRHSQGFVKIRFDRQNKRPPSTETAP